jgi:DNA-binding PucR family transcriptional regulator/putative methionine-R-sulfoxide reductase with GAF domain
MAGSRVRLFASLLERLRDRDLPSDEMTQAVVDAASRAMGTEVATLYVLDSCAGDLILAATRGLARAGVGFVTLKLGEGISGIAASSRTPVCCADVRLNQDFKLIPGFDQSLYQSILAVPVLDGGELVGALNVQSVEVREYDGWEQQELMAIGGMIAPILSSAWRAGDLALRLRGPRLLSSVDGYVSASLGPAQICEELATGLNTILPSVHCTIALGEPGAVPAIAGQEPEKTVRVALMECISRRATRESTGPPPAYLALPLRGESLVCGGLAVWTPQVDEPPWRAAHIRHYLETLANQTGLALERMLTQHAEGAAPELLAEESSLYGELVEMVLEDRSLQEVVERASRATETRIAIVDAFGTLLAGEMPQEPAMDFALRAADQPLGRMLASAAAAERPVLETVAQVVSLELAKWKVRFEVEARLRGDVMEALLAGGPGDARELQARASLVGLDLRREYTPVVFGFEEWSEAEFSSPLAIRGLIRAAHRYFGEAPVSVVFHKPEGLLVLVDSSSDALGRLDEAAADFKELARIQRLGIGVGVPVRDPADYAQSLRKAWLGATLGLRFHLSGPVTQSRLGVHGLLLAITEAERLDDFLDEQLGPLRASDEKTGGDLVRTLEAYHLSGERLRPAARMLYVHVNTLKYRLAKIEALTGRSLRNPVDRFNIYLALYALRLAEPNRKPLISDELDGLILSEVDDAW